MDLHVLPERVAGAAENMATDFLLLQRYPATGEVRFRHYGWRAPAFTFGYAQKLAFVQAQLPPGETFDLCRRPTGGGVVDHRDDWTYALVVPRGHPLEEVRATNSYRAVHEALAAALRAQGVPAVTKTAAPDPDEEPMGVCFQRAEIYDVVHEGTGTKIAGAAQKRNKHGLLFQGSIWRPAVGATIDWDAFHDAFVAALAAELKVPATPVPWPEFNEDEVSGLTEQYSASEWLGYR
ncbi:lipoate--protein ligase family protein [Opitutus sp. ER46]|uniref:lipoate--protein ligase family protein n=1 Tax=Opitutus sp. ER46 TaxID=2161864 RepID=UPI000D3209EB|nr:lipoate--protein ligase family protein [Opitutus sp. ER46]PTX98614.1 lipoate--protein ligase family protein [Opitutus sp. ER46]